MYCRQISGIDIDKTTDNGATFQPVTHGINQADIVSWVPPLVMDPNNSQILYFGTQYVNQSMDGANSWTPISFNMSPGGNGLSSTSVSPGSSNTVYVAAEAENLCVTNNALAGTNAIWTDIIDILPNGAITAVAADPHSASMAYVTFSGFNDIFRPGHAFMSSNNGGSWTDISGDLPDIPVNGIGIDPSSSNTIYVATTLGCFIPRAAA